jgi:hypothetical protein
LTLDHNVLALHARAIVPLARLEFAGDEDRSLLTCLQFDLDFRLWRLIAVFQKNDLGHRSGGGSRGYAKGAAGAARGARDNQRYRAPGYVAGVRRIGSVWP